MNPLCEHCQGYGVVFTHSEDRNDDLCALNGDMHSCLGELVPCECSEEPWQTAERLGYM